MVGVRSMKGKKGWRSAVGRMLQGDTEGCSVDRAGRGRETLDRGGRRSHEFAYVHSFLPRVYTLRIRRRANKRNLHVHTMCRSTSAVEKRARTEHRMRNAVEIRDAGLLASAKGERSIRFVS